MKIKQAAAGKDSIGVPEQQFFTTLKKPNFLKKLSF